MWDIKRCSIYIDPIVQNTAVVTSICKTYIYLFSQAFNDFTTMIQLNLYSDNSLNYMIEYYVTFFIEEWALQGIHCINVAKSGIVTAFEIPELYRTNVTLSLDTYYEPVCNSSCTDEVVYYQMSLEGTDICSTDAGKIMIKRAFLEIFDELYPFCSGSNR